MCGCGTSLVMMIRCPFLVGPTPRIALHTQTDSRVLAGSLVSSSFALSVSWAPQHLYGPHFQIWCALPSSRPKWTFPFPYSKYRSYSMPIHPSTGFIYIYIYIEVNFFFNYVLQKNHGRKWSWSRVFLNKREWRGYSREKERNIQELNDKGYLETDYKA